MRKIHFSARNILTKQKEKYLFPVLANMVATKILSLGKGIPVCQYTKDGLFIKIWNHAKEAGNTLGISPSSITDCCKHKRKSIGGYCWEYYNKK